MLNKNTVTISVAEIKQRALEELVEDNTQRFFTELLQAVHYKNPTISDECTIDITID